LRGEQTVLAARQDERASLEKKRQGKVMGRALKAFYERDKKEWPVVSIQ